MMGNPGASDLPSKWSMAVHILVVEDEFLLAMLLEDVVIAAGHVCVGPAATVAGAAVLLLREPCDLAVLDFGLGLDTVEPLTTGIHGHPFRLCERPT